MTTKRIFALVLSLATVFTMAISSYAYIDTLSLGINPDKVIGTDQSFDLIVYLDEAHTISPVTSYMDGKCSNPTIEYISSNEKVATVSPSGKVTTVGEGKCTITIKDLNTGESSSFPFTVNNSHSYSGVKTSIDFFEIIRNIINSILGLFVK